MATMELPMNSIQECKSMSPSLKSFVFVVSSVIGFSGTLLAQESQGAAETVGQKIDHAAETVGNKLEATKESLGERAEVAGDYLDDAAITALIKAEILGDPMLKVFQINVTTTDGVVNLSGAVDSQASIDRALAIARNNRSVKSVENGLVVKSVR
jgi:hyperosmotically inducible protein